MEGPTDCEHDGFAWRESGHGDLVLFLHGLGGSRLSWEPQLRAFGQRRRAAAWDMPGYGAAEPLPHARLTFDALAHAASDLIAVLGEQRAHVVGISMGGMVAQYLAAAAPRKVRSLTLLSSSPKFGLDGTDPNLWRAARLAPLQQGLEPADFAARVLRALAGPRIAPAALEEQQAAMARISGEALRRSLDVIVTHDSRDVLPGIACPTLVLVGALDQETPVSYSQMIVDLLPHATLGVVPGAGHLLNVEAPSVVNRLIEEHLTAVEAP